MTFSGSLADINAALEGLQYAASGAYSGTVSLQMTTRDQAPAAVGGSKTDVGTIAINVAATPQYHGLVATYWNNQDFTGTSVQQLDSTINFDWGQQGSPTAGIDGTTWSARWEGQITASTSGTYTFYATADDGVRLWVNGVNLVDAWRDQGATTYSGTIELAAGQLYSIRMDYYQGGGGESAKLEWSGPGLARQVIDSSHFNCRDSMPAPNVAPTISVPDAQTIREDASLIFSDSDDMTDGLVLHLDASTLGLADGAAVTTLGGATGTGNGAHAYDASNKPTYDADGLNGLGTVHFAGGTQGLQTDSNLAVSGDADRTIIVVMRRSASSDGSMAVHTGNSTSYEAFGICSNSSCIYAPYTLGYGGVGMDPRAGGEYEIYSISHDNASNNNVSYINGVYVGAASNDGINTASAPDDDWLCARTGNVVDRRFC